MTTSSSNFVLISGCSGGGKSTLLTELGRRGFAIVEEPGRRIVREENARGGRAVPWIDPGAFARRAIEMALADRVALRDEAGWVFFDRGLVDAAAALEALTGEPALKALDAAHPYHRRVFLAPPWPAIYVTDEERRHGFEAGLAEFARLERLLPALGYELVMLPKTSVERRADIVLEILGAQVAG